MADLLATQMPALDALAERAAVDRCEIISRLLAVALEDGGRPAARLLGKLAQPKRRYMSREDRAAMKAAEAATRAAQEFDRQAEAARRWATAPEPVRAAVAAGQHPLRAVRLHLGLRQRDVAERAGLGFYGETRVGEMERGDRPLTPRMRERLAAAMGVEAEWLGSAGLVALQGARTVTNLQIVSVD